MHHVRCHLHKHIIPNFALSYFIFPCCVAWSWIKRCVRARTVFGNRWAWRVYVQLDGGNPEERARRGRVIFIVAMMFLALALLSDPAPSKQAAAQAAAAEADADAPPPVRPFPTHTHIYFIITLMFISGSCLCLAKAATGRVADSPASSGVAAKSALGHCAAKHSLFVFLAQCVYWLLVCALPSRTNRIHHDIVLAACGGEHC